MAEAETMAEAKFTAEAKIMAEVAGAERMEGLLCTELHIVEHIERTADMVEQGLE